MGGSSLFAPQTLNLYTYCGNDPINHTDPSGLFWGKLFNAIGHFLHKAWIWIVVAVVVALVIFASVVSNGATSGFFYNLGEWIAKLGIAHAVETGGFVIGATGNALLITAGVGAIANQFTNKSGPKTRAFCNDLEGIINTIRPIINQVWNASDYGTPNAREQGGLISYSRSMGWFGKAYPRSPNEENINLEKGSWENHQINTPRGTYDRPEDEVYNVFEIHSHPFDSHKWLTIKGGDNNGKRVKSGNVEKPSGMPGKLGGDVNALPPSLIGIIVTRGAINIYTRIGRRCNFRR